MSSIVIKSAAPTAERVERAPHIGRAVPKAQQRAPGAPPDGFVPGRLRLFFFQHRQNMRLRVIFLQRGGRRGCLRIDAAPAQLLPDARRAIMATL